MSGWKDWQIGEVVTEGDFQSLVQDQVVQRYADASARTSALGTAVAEGMVSYLDSDNSLTVYDGSSWIPVGEGDITSVTAGTGLTGGGTAGDVTLSADYAAIGSAITVDQDQVTGLTSGTQGFTALSNGTAGISYQPVSHNYIINGAFDVWQRGTSGFTGSGIYTADRWRYQGNTDYTISRVAFSPGEIEAIGFGGADAYLSLVVNTNSQFTKIGQRLEDVKTLSGQTATLSFWAKGTNPAIGYARGLLQQNFAGGSSNVTKGVNFTLTASWQRFELTFTVDSVDGKTINAGSYFDVLFDTNDSTSAGWQLDLWGVQLEAGSVATPFKRHAPSLGLEEQACYRYYYRTPTTTQNFRMFSNIYGNSTTQARGVYKLPVTMRATPTFNASGAFQTNGQGGQITVTSLNLSRATPDAGEIEANVASGIVVGSAYSLRAGNDADAYIEFLGAEL